MHGNDAVIHEIPPSPESVIEFLKYNVNLLVIEGKLNNGQGNALIKKLDRVLKQLDRGSIKSALNELNAFHNQVSAFVYSGKLTQEEAQSLLDSAELIIILLGEDPPELPVNPDPSIKYSYGQFFLTDYQGRMSPTDYIMFAPEGESPEDGLRAPNVMYSEDSITAWGMVWYWGLEEGWYNVTVHAGDPATNPPLFDALPIYVPDSSGGL
ncbi:hypothetical protein ACFLWI_04700 [Chloroflexota bacterium]